MQSLQLYEGSSILSESDVRPQSVYAKSKLETNKLAKEFIGILILLLQVGYFNVYGPQDYEELSLSI